MMSFRYKYVLANLLLFTASFLYSSSLVQERTQLFFARATEEVLNGPEPRNQNAIEVGPAILSVRSIDLPCGQNLTAFLGGVLSKKYTNPSSDVIAVLAGLNEVDKRVSHLVNGIDNIARNGSSSASSGAGKKHD